MLNDLNSLSWLKGQSNKQILTWYFYHPWSKWDFPPKDNDSYCAFVILIRGFKFHSRIIFTILYNFEQLHLKKGVCVCVCWGKTRKCFAGRYMYFYTYNSPQTMATSLLEIYMKSKFTLIRALCLRSLSLHAGPIPNRSHEDHVMKKTISYGLIYSKLPQSHPKHLNFWRLVCPYSCTLRPKLH